MIGIHCLFEKVSDLTICLILSVLGLLFIILGFTVIPVLGVLISIPILLVAYAFFKAHRSKECMLKDQMLKEQKGASSSK